jgi:DNA (cytosine-5)-methyltransferase 1
LNVGSLFSGIGGIELGFEKAGFETVWFIECERYAKEIIKKHWRNAIVYDDVTKVDWRTIQRVDILTGGFPCQDISFAGKGVGISGSRSSLWKYYCESIRVLRPKYAFIENVSAIRGRGLNVVLGDLASLGYDAEWHCLPTSAVGAPHQRDRLFVIAYLPFPRDGRLSILSGRQAEKNSDVDRKSQIQNSDSNGLERVGRKTTKGCDTNQKHPFKSTGENVSDTESAGEIAIQQQGQRNVAIESSKIISDSIGVGSEEESIKGSYPGSMGDSDMQRLQNGKQKSGSSSSFERPGWWSTEPDLGRMADGIPFRVDRIRCLGNSVVPQIAEVFAQAIKEREEKTGGSQFLTRLKPCVSLGRLL